MAGRRTKADWEAIVAAKEADIAALEERLKEAAKITDEAVRKADRLEVSLGNEKRTSFARKEQIIALEAEKDAAWKAFEYVADRTAD